MCLAIVALPNAIVPEAHLRSGCKAMPDGFGFAYNAGGKVHVEKGFFDTDALVSEYKKAQKAHPESHFLIHMRASTHGSRNASNTHPFHGRYGAFIHNGVINGLGKKEISDTHHLAKLLHDVPERAIASTLNRIKDKYYVGKIAVLTPSNQIHIINETSGKWLNRVWYSNTSYSSGITYYGDRPVH